MSFTHKLNLNWDGGSRLLVSSNSYTGDAQGPSLAIPVADGVTDQLAVFTLDVSQIKVIYMKSDVAMTVETNSSSAPDETLVLVAGEPYIWWTGCLFTNLLATDITALYLTNASGAAGTFELEVVYDATP